MAEYAITWSPLADLFPSQELVYRWLHAYIQHRPVRGHLPVSYRIRRLSLLRSRQWINVVDRADVLSYGVSRIVSGTTDYCYPTDAIWAHSAYFRQPNFHLRLAERVKGALA
jgi:hypothetical protein